MLVSVPIKETLVKKLLIRLISSFLVIWKCCCRTQKMFHDYFCRTFNSAELLSDVRSMTCYQNICFCAKKHSWKNYYFKLHKPVCQFVFHLLDFDLKDFILFPAQYPITPHRIMFEGISFRSFVSICRFVCVYLSFFFFCSSSTVNFREGPVISVITVKKLWLFQNFKWTPPLRFKYSSCM